MMRLPALFNALLLACVIAHANEPDRKQQAEIRLDRYEIYPTSITEPTPAGLVDENPPFLHFQKTYADARLHRREKLDTLFYFRLARNADMKSPVFESGPRRWSFYCPYKALEEGTWYWQCGVASKTASESIQWSAVISFTITGKEILRNVPRYEVLEAGLLKNGHPRVQCRAADIGRLMPDDPKLAQELLATAETALKQKLPSTFMDFKQWDDPKVRKSGTTKAQKASYVIGGFERNKVMPVVRGFLLTGDKRFLREALAASEVLVKGYQELKANDLAEGFVVDIYGNLVNTLYDSLYNDLDPRRRAELQAAVATEGRESFETLLDDYEHIPYNEHRWQSFIRSAVLKTMALVGDEPQASEWMRYLYDLWNFKVPGAGRNDGGWFTGTGYFTASCETLFLVPYLFSQYTGADFFDHPWYKNVGRYVCYSSPRGHPSEGFGDKAGDYYAPVMGLVRNLRYIHPENPWNHRYYLTQREANARGERYSAFLMDNTKWYELQLRKQHPGVSDKYSDPIKIIQQAAFFPDTGYVAMFTDVDNLDANAMINFRSCPFGQNGHAHAAQNATSAPARSGRTGTPMPRRMHSTCHGRGRSSFTGRDITRRRTIRRPSLTTSTAAPRIRSWPTASACRWRIAATAGCPASSTARVSPTAWATPRTPTPGSTVPTARCSRAARSPSRPRTATAIRALHGFGATWFSFVLTRCWCTTSWQRRSRSLGHSASTRRTPSPKLTRRARPCGRPTPRRRPKPIPEPEPGLRSPTSSGAARWLISNGSW